MRRVLTAAAAILALTCALAPSASAHTKTYRTSSTFLVQAQPGAPGKYIFSGTVSSSNQRCVGGRTVDVVLEGGIAGTTVADSAGNWSIGPVNADDTAGASVRQKKLRKNDKHKHICKSFLSNSSQG